MLNLIRKEKVILRGLGEHREKGEGWHGRVGEGGRAAGGWQLLQEREQTGMEHFGARPER